MHDPGGRWDHPEVAKGLLSPLQELVALLVPLELPAAVDHERVRTVEHVDLDRVVHDQVARNPGVHFVG